MASQAKLTISLSTSMMALLTFKRNEVSIELFLFISPCLIMLSFLQKIIMFSIQKYLSETSKYWDFTDKKLKTQIRVFLLNNIDLT